MTQPIHIETSPFPSVAQASAEPGQPGTLAAAIEAALPVVLESEDLGIETLTADLARAAEVAELTTHEPKHQRRQQIQITVRYDERELAPELQLKLFTLRQEITALNRSLRQRNEALRRVRHENRLFSRVMRLKSEAYQAGAARERVKILAEEG